MSESTVAAPDAIEIFVRGEDKIDLSLIDANTLVAGDQHFTFVGTGTAGIGRLQYVGGIVSADVNGDGVADFAIKETFAANLSAADFLL